jgi:predicted molibdopterin-dependent oxidoreductase YjgC
MTLQCDFCQKVIEDGDPYKSLNLHRERKHGNTITVDYAEVILVTCISCGSNMQRLKVARVLEDDTGEKARLMGELFVPSESR